MIRSKIVCRTVVATCSAVRGKCATATSVNTDDFTWYISEHPLSAHRAHVTAGPKLVPVVTEGDVLVDVIWH